MTSFQSIAKEDKNNFIRTNILFYNWLFVNWIEKHTIDVNIVNSIIYWNRLL